MKTVVFDMDGVLFDTETICMRVWVDLAKEMGLSGMEEVFPRCIGGSAERSRKIVREAYGPDFDYDDFRRRASDGFWSCIEREGLPVKPGAEEVLSGLREEGWTIGLASSTKRDSVLKCLERAGLRDFFSVIVTGDMVQRSKPEPDIYLLACGELSAEPAGVYAVEDSPNGVRSAHAAGMRPLMVPDMLAPDEEMRELAEEIFEDLYGVLAYLRKQA